MLPPDTSIDAQRIRLRPISLDDIPFIFDASRHEGFCDGMHWEPPSTEAELQAPYESNIRSWAEGLAYTFTIEGIDDSTPIGRICIRQLNGSIWDFGFWAHPKFYGQGYMTEAVESLMEFGFRELGITEFHAAYATWNIASKRVLEKTGFRFLRHDPAVHIKHGQSIDENVLHIKRDFKTV